MFMNKKRVKITKSLLIILSLIIIVTGAMILYRKPKEKEDLKDRVVLNQETVAYNSESINRALKLMEDLEGFNGEEYEVPKKQEDLFAPGKEVFTVYKNNKSYAINLVTLGTDEDRYYIYSINSRYYRLEESKEILEYFSKFYNEVLNIAFETNIRFIEEVEEIYLKSPFLNMRDMKLEEENFKKVKEVLIKEYGNGVDTDRGFRFGNEKYTITLKKKDGYKKVNLYNDSEACFYSNSNFSTALILSREVHNIVEDILPINIDKDNLNYILLSDSLKLYVNGKDSGRDELDEFLRDNILKTICNGNFFGNEDKEEISDNMEIILKIKGEEVRLKVLPNSVVFNSKTYKVNGIYGFLKTYIK